MKTLFSLSVASIVGFAALTSDAAELNCQKGKGKVVEQKTDAKGNTIIVISVPVTCKK